MRKRIPRFNSIVGKTQKRGIRSMYEDKKLVCKECGQEFIFTAGEQEFYAERGFANEPQRCKACRQAKKASTMYEAVCDDCGGVARVPFKPSEDKPVYCSACFEKRKNNA